MSAQCPDWRSQPSRGVRTWQHEGQEMLEPPSAALVDEPEPDFKTISLLNPEPPSAVHVHRPNC